MSIAVLRFKNRLNLIARMTETGHRPDTSNSRLKPLFDSAEPGRPHNLDSSKARFACGGFAYAKITLAEKLTTRLKEAKTNKNTVELHTTS